MPNADTSPTPVTTTRLLKPPPSSSLCRADPRGPATILRPGAAPLLLGLGVLLDVVHGLAHARDLLGVLVRDLDAELFLEGHDELHRVERVRPEVVHERG